MASYCFGIDIGGTTVKCGLFLTTGELCEKWEIKTRTEDGGKAILPDVAAAIQAKMEEKGIAKEQVTGVGVGVPGPVVKEREVTVAVNLHWGHTMLADELEALLGGIPVKVGNDANVAALYLPCRHRGQCPEARQGRRNAGSALCAFSRP